MSLEKEIQELYFKKRDIERRLEDLEVELGKVSMELELKRAELCEKS